MVFDIKVNNKTIKAKRGEYILTVLNRNGIKIPTLCYLNDLFPAGSCRICIVEVEGKDELITACDHFVEEWMSIKTHSPKVIKARKTILELLIANHPNDCLYCDKNGDCELQNLAEELNITEHNFFKSNKNYKIDITSPALIFDPGKCILCGRCVRICNEVIGVSAIDILKDGENTFVATTNKKDLNHSGCVNCGQCTLVCPTAAFSNKNQFGKIQTALNNKEICKIAFYSSDILISIAQKLNLNPDKKLKLIINAAIRNLGFDKVFDINLAYQLTVEEQADEIISKINNSDNEIMFLSYCPAWMKYAEENMQNFYKNISSCKSPEQIFASLLKTYFADNQKLSPKNIHTTLITSCTASKYEIQKDEFITDNQQNIDTVLTTKEFLKLIKLYGIDINNIKPENTDLLLNDDKNSDKIIFSNYAEDIIKALHLKLTGEKLSEFKINKNEKNKLQYLFNETKIGKNTFRTFIVTGIDNLKNLIKDIKKENNVYNIIEFMMCPNGCVEGGGQFFSYFVNSFDSSSMIIEKSKNEYINYDFTGIHKFAEKYFENNKKRLLHRK